MLSFLSYKALEGHYRRKEVLAVFLKAAPLVSGMDKRTSCDALTQERTHNIWSLGGCTDLAWLIRVLVACILPIPIRQILRASNMSCLQYLVALFHALIHMYPVELNILLKLQPPPQLPPKNGGKLTWPLLNLKCYFPNLSFVIPPTLGGGGGGGWPSLWCSQGYDAESWGHFYLEWVVWNLWAERKVWLAITLP